MSRAIVIAFAAFCLFNAGEQGAYAAPANVYREASLELWAEQAPIEDGFNLVGVVEDAGDWSLLRPVPQMTEVGFLVIQDELEISDKSAESEVVAIPEPSSLILLSLIGGLIMFLRWRWG